MGSKIVNWYLEARAKFIARRLEGNADLYLQYFWKSVTDPLLVALTLFLFMFIFFSVGILIVGKSWIG
jgi:hypothetical protein